MRKALAIITACVIALGLVTASAATADVNNKCDVRITVMGTNAKGTDAAWNRNEEYVWLKNVTSEDKNVFGWKLTDAAGNETKFTEDNLQSLDATATTLVLPAGHSILVYSGAGTDTTPDNNVHTIYRNGKHYLNNSSGESVKVIDADGTVVERTDYSAYGINPYC